MFVVSYEHYPPYLMHFHVVMIKQDIMEQMCFLLEPTGFIGINNVPITFQDISAIGIGYDPLKSQNPFDDNSKSLSKHISL